MVAPVVIADELTAAGYRLAGAHTIVPSERNLSAIFAAARTDCEVLLVTAALTARLPAPELESARVAERPLLLVIPDALRRSDPPDLAHELQRVLGVET